MATWTTNSTWPQAQWHAHSKEVDDLQKMCYMSDKLLATLNTFMVIICTNLRVGEPLLLQDCFWALNINFGIKQQLAAIGILSEKQPVMYESWALMPYL